MSWLLNVALKADDLVMATVAPQQMKKITKQIITRAFDILNALSYTLVPHLTVGY